MYPNYWALKKKEWAAKRASIAVSCKHIFSCYRCLGFCEVGSGTSLAHTRLTCAALRESARNKAAKTASKERRDMALQRNRMQGARYDLLV